jgi:hypothetical protein
MAVGALLGSLEGLLDSTFVGLRLGALDGARLGFEDSIDKKPWTSTSASDK